jgi:DNA topoisomerase IB
MKKPKYTDIKVLDNGRKVYLYGNSAIKSRFAKKDKKLSSIKSEIGEIISRVRQDISNGSEPALIVGLILCTYERVGNDESASAGHYGASNLEKRHVSKLNDGIMLDYIAKSGVHQNKIVTDSLIIKEISRRLVGKSSKDRIFLCTPKQVNDYLSKFGITSKDIRTFAANKFMSDALLSSPKHDRQSDRRRVFGEKLIEVSQIIGHNPKTLSSMYLSPSLKKNYIESGRIKRFTRRK